jgi:hypothetical protein
VAPKLALGSGEKVSALQDPDEAMVHPALQCLTKATSEADRAITGCLRAISARFRNRDDDSFFLGIWHEILRTYTTA